MRLEVSGHVKKMVRQNPLFCNHEIENTILFIAEYHIIKRNKTTANSSIACSMDSKVSSHGTGRKISLNKFGDELLQALFSNSIVKDDKMASRKVCNNNECHCWKGFKNGCGVGK
jgi:hypothetical protein